MATRPYFQGRHHFGIYLNERERKDLERALRKQGWTFADFVRASMERVLSERLPESQDGLQRVQIDRGSAQNAADALIAKAEELRRSAERVYNRRHDLEHRTELRREAEGLDDLAAWFLEIVDGADHRRHVIDAGMKAPRHRYKDGAAAQSS